LEGNVKALSKRQPKSGRENQYKPIARKDEGTPSGKGGQVLVEPKPEPKVRTALAEPEKTPGGFSKVSVGLGEGKGTVIAAVGSAVAPIPLFVAAEDQDISPITNGTETNATETIPPIKIEEIQGPSVLEPASITDTRPSVRGAITSGTGLDLYTGVTPRARIGLGLDTTSRTDTRSRDRLRQPTILSYAEVTGLRQPVKERQRTAQPFPDPTRQPQRLKQPEAFKEKPILKLQEPEIPKVPPRQRFDIPFAEKKERKTKREKEEEKEKIPFIGNVFEDQIEGGFKEFDIKYGAKKVSRQSALGLSMSRKGRQGFAETKSSSFLDKKKEKARQAIVNTWSDAMMGLIRDGTAYAPNGTIVNDYYAAFGVTRSNLTINLVPSDSPKPSIQAAIDNIVDNFKGGFVPSRFVAFAGRAFFDALAGHPFVLENARIYSSEMQSVEVLTGILGTQGYNLNARYQVLDFGGVIWIRVSSTTEIAADEARLFPTDLPDLFKIFFAPSDLTFDTINSPAQEEYYFEKMESDRTALNFSYETNFLVATLWPKAIVKLTAQYV